MSRSGHRYTLHERASMDTQPLDELIARFGRYQEARGFTQGTKDRYRFTFLLFGRFLEATGRPATSAALSTETMEAFASWLRETSARRQRGQTRRAERASPGTVVCWSPWSPGVGAVASGDERWTQGLPYQGS